MSIKSLSLAFLGLFLLSGVSFAGTSADVTVERGQSDTMSYGVAVTQTYEPWISGSIGELTPTTELSGHLWVPDEDRYDKVWGASLAPGLKFSMFTDAGFRPFIAASVGGAAVSSRDVETRKLGSNVLFKTKGAAGIEFGENSQHKIQGEYTHYSTWGLADHDDGYSTYGASYGYSF